jgi:hypothetical protein
MTLDAILANDWHQHRRTILEFALGSLTKNKGLRNERDRALLNLLGSYHSDVFSSHPVYVANLGSYATQIKKAKLNGDVKKIKFTDTLRSCLL